MAARTYPAGYKSFSHWQVARNSRGDVMRGGGVAVHIDTKEIERLQKALRESGMNYQRQQAVLVQSLNRAGARLQTQ